MEREIIEISITFPKDDWMLVLTGGDRAYVVALQIMAIGMVFRVNYEVFDTKAGEGRQQVIQQHHKDAYLL